MADLLLHHKYTRREVHDYFVPGCVFTPNSGTWGLHGCVRVPNTNHDFVFFVTYGQSQGDHFFQEGISKDGVITWQSQPRQHLNEARVLRWIEQSQQGDNIYLFVRSKKSDAYTFFGDISYLSHDPYKEYPVWFEFKINNWNAPENIIFEFVRTPTAGLSQTKTPAQLTRASTNKSLVRAAHELNRHDEHLRNLLTTNPQLIDAGEGFRWEADYEFDIGDSADIIFFGPGREAKVIGICTSEQEVSYLKAVKAKLWRSQFCFERGEDEASEFIQCYLVAKSVDSNTKSFCEKYDVNLITA